MVVHSHRWAKRSMMAGLIDHWSGKPTKLTFEIIEKAYRLSDILRWCRRLVRALAGAKVIVIWDRLQAHRSKAVKAFLAIHGVEVVLLPGYAPQLNPTEWLWANLKGSELANFCVEDITKAENLARRGPSASAGDCHFWMAFRPERGRLWGQYDNLYVKDQ